MKYVSPLTEGEIKRLEDIRKSDKPSQVRDRAHYILLSNAGYKIDDIARIFDVERRTVSSWTDAWEYSSFEGLHDKPRSGRPEILSEEEKEIAKKLIEENPRSLKSVVHKLAEITGKVVSVKTLKRLAKKCDLVWKRVRKSVRPKRNKKESGQAKKEIGELKKQQKNGDTDIYYSDESGFDPEPTVPYAWQPKGETIEIPSFKGSRINVPGFLNTENNDFFCFTWECSVDTDVAVACFDRFSEEITKETYVIPDNAPCHTSGEFLENIEKWEEKGLFLIYLPAYSPELNLIEILRRFIKYTWLSFPAYTSQENLVKELNKVLAGIGSEYVIDFSQ